MLLCGKKKGFYSYERKDISRKILWKSLKNDFDFHFAWIYNFSIWHPWCIVFENCSLSLFWVQNIFETFLAIFFWKKLFSQILWDDKIFHFFFLQKSPKWCHCNVQIPWNRPRVKESFAKSTKLLHTGWFIGSQVPSCTVGSWKGRLVRHYIWFSTTHYPVKNTICYARQRITKYKCRHLLTVKRNHQKQWGQTSCSKILRKNS